eukprot:TRINITY_DN6089_c0_g1_i11.p1 TRINITY_DN6089_c0_g1~~TRINITY_DN6089_c0_g1_i11.p1  ORF type:complete len:122 (-),score=22.44 TRINITY_DN6089_c0_g1_i11:324-689(-)
MDGEDHFVFIIVYAVVCGVLWIAAGGVALLAAIKMERVWIWISAVTFLVGYMIFIGLFGTIMVDLNMKRRDLKVEEINGGARYCETEWKKFTRSSDEFIAYSVCSFVFTALSIICTLASLG